MTVNQQLTAVNFSIWWVLYIRLEGILNTYIRLTNNAVIKRQFWKILSEQDNHEFNLNKLLQPSVLHQCQQPYIIALLVSCASFYLVYNTPEIFSYHIIIFQLFQDFYFSFSFEAICLINKFCNLSNFFTSWACSVLYCKHWKCKMIKLVK